MEMLKYKLRHIEGIAWNSLKLLAGAASWQAGPEGPEEGLEGPACRICLEGDDVETLVSPCACRGTRGRAVTTAILQSWLCWLVVWNMLWIFSIDWESHHPNWRNHMVSEGWLNHQPDTLLEWSKKKFDTSWLAVLSAGSQRILSALKRAVGLLV